MPFYDYNFTAPVTVHEIAAKTPGGRVLRYTVVWLPEALHDRLPLKAHPRLRVSAEVGEQPLEGAFQPWKGRWYLMLGKALLREVGLAPGDVAEVRFAVADQDAVDVPTALSAALIDGTIDRALWEAMTPGRQRLFAHHVASAKREATQQKRIAEIAIELTTANANGRAPTLRKDLR